jgi:hypothetical protein
MGIWDPLVFAFGFNQVQHGFEFPDNHHIPEDTEQIVLGKPGELLPDRSLIGIDRNGAQIEGLGPSDL